MLIEWEKLNDDFLLKLLWRLHRWSGRKREDLGEMARHSARLPRFCAKSWTVSRQVPLTDHSLVTRATFTLPIT